MHKLQEDNPPSSVITPIAPPGRPGVRLINKR